MAEAKQFIGRECFLVTGERAQFPGVEIHILKHSADEDNIPKQELTIKGMRDLRAIRDAINWTLNEVESNPLKADEFIVR